jgi:hypothetical protein
MAKWTFRNKRTGRFRACRLSQLDALYNDPMSEGAPLGDFVNDWRRQDLRDGCPRCRAEVIENLSEPDVMQRWGIR